MPLSSIEAVLVSLVGAAINAVVALQFIGESEGTRIETVIVGLLAAIFPIANAIIHHGVTAATGRDASSKLSR